MRDKDRVGGKEQKEKDTAFIEMVSTSKKEVDRQTHREKEIESDSDKESERWRQEKWKRRVRASLIKREGD